MPICFAWNLSSDGAAILVPDHDSVNPVTDPDSPAILLAEDDPVTRLLMARLLNRAGYRVEAVAHGAAALDKMARNYYPILITDWEMPEMDGVALCRMVRTMQLDGYVYSLLLTARDSKEHIIAGLEAGADDYLVKPVHEPELIARLNTGRRLLALEHSLRAANDRNRILSITDALTGSYNRRYLMEQLPRELERCRRYGYPLTVLMCDIDHFKQFNDSFGHAAGDEVLQQFVARIQRVIRVNSDWLARYGGEEFVVLLPETSYENAFVVAEKIRAALACAPFVTRSGQANVTASFGIAASGPHGPELTLNADALLRSADESLYRSKETGRNRVNGVELTTALLRSVCA